MDVTMNQEVPMSILFQFDRPSFILFYVVTVLWIAEFVIFPSKTREKDKNETRSFLRIMAMIVVSHLLSIGFTVFGWFRIEGTLPALTVIAIITYPLGLALRYVSVIHLGKHFTRDVEVSKTQTLVSTGPYRVLRHPLYLGLFLLTVSVPMFFSNWLMTIVSAVTMFTVLDHRMGIEEAMMEEVIGDPYLEWKRARYRFIPFIY
jgi:protein-S-isoprenylcysteine O-methyltransferase Ste14